MGKTYAYVWIFRQRDRFLNFVLMYFVETRSDKPFRVDSRKIGLNVLEAFLPGKETYPEEAYVLCSRILRTYGKLSVRIDGKERLEKCMNETFRVENVKNVSYVVSI